MRQFARISNVANWTEKNTKSFTILTKPSATLGRNGPRAGHGIHRKDGIAVIANILDCRKDPAHLAIIVPVYTIKYLITGSRERRAKMKLTPEQKALFEYGQEYKDMMICRWEYNAGVCARINLEARIRRAWKMRAVCRAWTIPSAERICENCTHEGTHPLETPCLDCLRNQSVYCEEGGNAGDGDYWEPRKEGE